LTAAEKRRVKGEKKAISCGSIITTIIAVRESAERKRIHDLDALGKGEKKKKRKLQRRDRRDDV